ncbi:MAG TPA: divergent PAP2 family protein [Candidatus Saccharimonadia bacterium]|nr:divergent PAP2 family protein [Candidatus Saccharimonadia bacterium]
MVYNPYIAVPLATWAVAQVAKFAIEAMKGRIDFRYLYASGGMPSVHSAVVTSLATTSFLVDGAGSHLFGLTAILAVIVMYDSFGVRRSSGEQAMALNMLLQNLDRNRFKLDEPPPRIREILGHQPREVTVGAAVGVALAMLFNYDHLGKFGTFVRVLPVRYELWAYLVVFGALVVGGLILRVVLARKYRKSTVMKRFRARVFVAAQTVGWIGLATCLFAYERASYLSWRLWPLLMMVVGVVWGIWLLTGSAKEVPAGLAAEANHARKQKWLNFGRKSR